MALLEVATSASRVAERLRILGNSEILGNSRKWEAAEPSTQSPRNTILVLVVKNYAKIDIKVSSFYPILLFEVSLRILKLFMDASTCHNMALKLSRYSYSYC